MSFSFSVGNEEKRERERKKKNKTKWNYTGTTFIQTHIYKHMEGRSKKNKERSFFHMEYSVSLQGKAGTAVVAVGFSKSKSCYEKLTKLILNWHKVTEKGSFQGFFLCLSSSSSPKKQKKKYKK